MIYICIGKTNTKMVRVALKAVGAATCFVAAGAVYNNTNCLKRQIEVLEIKIVEDEKRHGEQRALAARIAKLQRQELYREAVKLGSEKEEVEKLFIEHARKARLALMQRRSMNRIAMTLELQRDNARGDNAVVKAVLVRAENRLDTLLQVLSIVVEWENSGSSQTVSALSEVVKGLEAEKEESQQQLDLVREELAQVKAATTNIIAARNAIIAVQQTALTNASNETARWRTGYEEAIREQHRLQQLLVTVTGERDGMAMQRNTQAGECEVLRRQLADLQMAFDAVTLQRNGAEMANGHIQEQLEHTAQHAYALQDQLDDVHNQLADAAQARDHHITVVHGLQRQLADSYGANQALEQDLNAVVGQRARLGHDVIALQERVHALEGMHASATDAAHTAHVTLQETTATFHHQLANKDGELDRVRGDLVTVTAEKDDLAEKLRLQLRYYDDLSNASNMSKDTHAAEVTAKDLEIKEVKASRVEEVKALQQLVNELEAEKEKAARKERKHSGSTAVTTAATASPPSPISPSATSHAAAAHAKAPSAEPKRFADSIVHTRHVVPSSPRKSSPMAMAAPSQAGAKDEAKYAWDTPGPPVVYDVRDKDKNGWWQKPRPYHPTIECKNFPIGKCGKRWCPYLHRDEEG